MSEAKEAQPWDLESVYDKEIAPLMARIIEICKEHRLPFVASVAYKGDTDDDDFGLCSTYLEYDGERPRVEELYEASRVIRGGSRGLGPAMRLRTTDADGKTTAETIIL